MHNKEEEKLTSSVQNVKIRYNERESGKDVNVSFCREVGGGGLPYERGQDARRLALGC